MTCCIKLAFMVSPCKIFYLQHLPLCLKQSTKIGTRWDMKTKLLSQKRKFCRKQRIFVTYCSTNLSSNWYVHSQLFYEINFPRVCEFQNLRHQLFIVVRNLLFSLWFPQPSSSWDAALTEAIEKLLSCEILSSEEVKLHSRLFMSAATWATYT